MGNINICGRAKCCPDVTTNRTGEKVQLKENGVTIELTFEQVALIYKKMCVQRDIKCNGRSC